MKKIIMYTKNNCPNCNRAKFMIEVAPCEVELEVRNIEKNEDWREDLVRFRSMSVPTFLIPVEEDGFLEDADGVQYNVYTGFDENLGKIQKYLGLWVM